MTSNVVKNQGFTFDITRGGHEAIDIFIANNNYDFILMDIMMPDIYGFEATKRIKALKPEQKIIALTAMSLRENKERFVDSDFESVIEKTFEINKFNALIQSLVF